MPSSASSATATYTLSLHDALPILERAGYGLIETLRVREGRVPFLERHLARLERSLRELDLPQPSKDVAGLVRPFAGTEEAVLRVERSEEHTSELQSLRHLVCRLLLRPPPRPTLFPYTTLFRSWREQATG